MGKDAPARWRQVQSFLASHVSCCTIAFRRQIILESNMPRGKKTNKSQAIRELVEQNPKVTAKEVVDLLAKKGIKVKTGLVYMIKGRLKQMKVYKTRKAARVTRAGQKTGSSDPVALILKVKELAKEAGGLENLKNLVSVLAD